MKRFLFFNSFLYIFLCVFSGNGMAQASFYTNNIWFDIDIYGLIQVHTFSEQDTIWQIDKASILVAGNPYQVYDYLEDVDIVNPIATVPSPPNSDFEAAGLFNNAYSNLPPDIILGENVYGWNGESCLIIKFEVTNNESFELPTIVGLDINPEIDSTWENDVIYFNQSNSIFYNYEHTYIGFKILSDPTLAATKFPWYSTYSDNDSSYYSWLTGGIDTDTLITDPNGAVGILGTGSVQLQPQEKRTVYMAIAIGTDETSMLSNMALAEGHYGVITSVDERIYNSLTYKLEQNYPNPFNPSTAISFSIPEREAVSLDVYNLLGQKISNIINKEMEPGSYKINFDASNLAAGIYFYTLRAGNFTSTKKMMMLK